MSSNRNVPIAVLPLELRQLIGSYNIMARALVTIVTSFLSLAPLNDTGQALMKRMVDIINKALVDNGFRSYFKIKDRVTFHQDYSQLIDYKVFVTLIKLVPNSTIQHWLVARLNKHWGQNGSNRRLVLMHLSTNASDYQLVEINIS